MTPFKCSNAKGEVVFIWGFFVALLVGKIHPQIRFSHENKWMFPPRLELGTFRVLGGRDNHYTTGTCWVLW